MSAYKAVSILLLAFSFSVVAWAGGPGNVAGAGFDAAVRGKPLVWDTSTPVRYRTPSSGTLGKLDNASAVARVEQLFKVWEDVKTANISFQRDGNIAAAGVYKDGPVDTAAKFNDVEDSCGSGVQSPIVFDSNGSLFTALGIDDDVIAFAGPCVADGAGHILAAEAVLNGKWLDNNQANGELSDRQFDETLVHEFGHFIGLDHSQISLVVLSQPVDQCNRSDLEVLPIMFPFAHCQARLDENLPALSPDDEAWISFLYQETVNDPPGPQQAHIRFDSVYGIISGKVFFGDGATPAQGFNVLARDTDTSRNRTFSVVSGYLFTASIGQSVSVGQNGLPDNPNGSRFGSRDLALIGKYEIPVLPGNFEIRVEEIFRAFDEGSSVGPLFPIPLPGFSPPPPVTVTVTVPGTTPVMAPDIVLTDQLQRFDMFEGQ